MSLYSLRCVGFFGFLGMTISLTPRQEAFIRQLIELYRRIDGPIHYASLAKELGVSPFTAYDMLRVLEDKGMVSATYTLDEGKSGPGRSRVVFEPTNAAHAIIAEIAGDSENWEDVQEKVLELIRQGRDPELTGELLQRVPLADTDHSQYCLEFMTSLVLRLRSKKARKMLIAFLDEILPNETDVSSAKLSLLGGYILGLLAEDPSWSGPQPENIQRYQDFVEDMGDEDRMLMVRSLLSAFEPIRN